MSDFIAVFADSLLCEGLGREQTVQVLDWLLPAERLLTRGESLFTAGNPTRFFGLTIEGSLHIVKHTYEGNMVLVAELERGDIFAESFAFSSLPLTVSVHAASAARVFLIDSCRLLSGEECPFRPLLLENMLRIFSRKNMFLTARIEHLSKRTLRERLLSYLGDMAEKAGSLSFSIPFDRQGLADYLAADRSALSAVLGRLRDEGVLSFYKNRFTLNP